MLDITVPPPQPEPSTPPPSPTTLIPLYDRVLVQRDVTPEQLGGIHIPQNQRKPCNTGTIVAVGEGRLCPTLPSASQNVGDITETLSCHVEPLRVKVGDRIIFNEYAGNEVAYKNAAGADCTVLIMSEDEIICLIR